ncbi:putative membrane protein [Williamsia limnetica]|uniref:Putative membrane protein n=1 Tax=Williamsia limnetica TaxID=882452 RepID=A0A318RKS3_WILLI|nr:cytochrome c oxidase assembly protein [Williamsia limnetica]PYE18628.1 putative membrane protein [Williamsia limnetica]
MNALAHGANTAPSTDWGVWFTYAALATAAIVYLVVATRQQREPRGWSRWRTTSFVVGIVILMVALRPSVSESFGDHMTGHLLIGMFAPLALVMAAPVTLYLRTVSARRGRALVHALAWKPLRWVINPITLLVANVGGLAVLYLTPLYAFADSYPLVHTAVHVHFFVAGYLFAWMIAGPDPGPSRPSVPRRLVVLGIAIAGHAVLAQMLYAGIFVRVDAPPSELRDGGTLMYYWGDLAEILLALALLLTWTPDHRRGSESSKDGRGHHHRPPADLRTPGPAPRPPTGRPSRRT